MEKGSGMTSLCRGHFSPLSISLSTPYTHWEEFFSFLFFFFKWNFIELLEQWMLGLESGLSLEAEFYGSPWMTIWEEEVER